MKKNPSSFAVCLLLLGQFPIVAVTGLVEHHPLPSLRGIVGLTLIACSIFHLFRHAGWIDAILHKYDRMPAPAHTNAFIDLSLFSGYLACGFTGLLASEFPSQLTSHVHWIFGFVVIGVQLIHLARHRKWLQGFFKRPFIGFSHSRPSAG